ncbi:MAG: UDP-N-acetylglucosamine--N-acetylmuramyl-(pentapeptide) pyrophosphoryl-undecaprenol N-acetylglucosamine transferase [Candidatus Paceibacterota bacterium]|jgi:UDP-N-acetylglucosamine--N-acetylmuramyl-(pentapeptide) pyrophosphoryl-undecaprenol N-acetylglucosamine transferase
MPIRIGFAGGGSGGHLYPLLAVADALRKEMPHDLELLYFGPHHILAEDFEAREIRSYAIASSKFRRYFDIANIIDIPKFFWSIFQALVKLYITIPDAIFSKGGPGALAVVLVARWYRIPVVIHESDAVPGLTNRISASFAQKILVSFKNAEQFFSKGRVTMVGNPVREGLGSGYGDSKILKEQMQFDSTKPLLLVLGGSQGSQRMNSFILDNLEELIKEIQILHQVGVANYENAYILSQSAIKNIGETFASHYRLTPYFANDQMREALSAADIVMSRAGSGAIFEIAASGKPAILIPLSDSAGDHQRANAYEYTESGAGITIEETNFTLNLVLSQIRSILKNEEMRQKMHQAALNFYRPTAAADIATEVIQVAKKVTKPAF